MVVGVQIHIERWFKLQLGHQKHIYNKPFAKYHNIYGHHDSSVVCEVDHASNNNNNNNGPLINNLIFVVFGVIIILVDEICRYHLIIIIAITKMFTVQQTMDIPHKWTSLFNITLLLHFFKHFPVVTGNQSDNRKKTQKKQSFNFMTHRKNKMKNKVTC